MEAASIMQLLKGFCDNSKWQYAVFWKLNHHFPMTLTWENGYQKRNETVGIMQGEGADDSRDYSAQLLMDEMSHRKYSLGEGVVGKIALAKDHFWVSCEDIFTSKFDGNLIPECLDEWLLQFASGIKAIVLVPIVPLGVLQFGSFEAVAEDLEFITEVKEKFRSIRCLEANATPLNLGINYQDWSVSALSHNLMDSLDETSSVTNSILKGEASASTALNINESTGFNPTMPSFIQDDYCLSRENQLKYLKRANVNEVVSSSFETSVDPIETKSNHREEEIGSWSHFVGNKGMFGEISDGLSSFFGNNVIEQRYGGTETGHGDAKSLNDFSTFPSESELHKALGSVAYRQTGKCMSKYLSIEDISGTSTLIPNKKEHDHFKGLGFPEEIDPEFLLDAVVGNLSSGSDDTAFISNSVRSLITKPTEFTGSIKPKFNAEESTVIVKNSDVRSDLMSAEDKDEFTNHLTSSFVGNSSILIDESLHEKVNNHMQPTSGLKLSSTGKKRVRVSNNQKARPRDRQMIMDRMKELRELIPDGGRCSIDNLLERTIKHMVYLRKITSQAEKLKRFADHEVPRLKKQKINGSHPGRSCAFDFESEQAWPVVIEDLECSGHMLIEMICSEHGLFLEIAQVIRRLDITILKGILENRSSTNWACFIVEVPRGFHRMDVLCPLLHLLQPRRNGFSKS